MIEFQSLTGFLMHCKTFTTMYTFRFIKFHSLSGFLKRCDPAGVRRQTGGDRVSIPIGFSDAL